MDMSKRKVSWLETFPPDIWAYFVCYLSGEQLGRLMMTGATLLSHRLTSPRVVRSIKLGKDAIGFKSFPRFINDFASLEELSIYSSSADWSTKLALTINLIPSGVRKLELSGNWENSADALFGEDGTTLKLTEHLPRLESLDLYDLSFTNYSWICHCPQSLTKLRVESWDGSVELPASLIHFEAYHGALSTSSLVPKLPPSLETLDVRQNLKGLELIASFLPPSIRTLSFGTGTSAICRARSAQSLLEQLPKSLTWLEVPHLGATNFETNPELTSLLPPTLTELHLHSVLPCSVWHLLPRLLRTTSFFPKESVCTVASQIIDHHGVHHQVKSIPFDLLPETMTRLELKSGKFLCCPPSPLTSHRSYFPPQLTRLEMHDILLSPEAVKLLPSSLTWLDILNLCERVCEHLPKSLKTLKSRGAVITPNLIKFLPTSLTSLRVHIPNRVHNWIDYNTGKRIDSISKLPEYSKLEKCVSQHFEWKNHFCLPSTLTDLHIWYAYELGDTFMQHHRLPHLIELNLQESKHFTDLSIPLLSPNLTLLNLRSSSNITGKSFEFLPRYLTYLTLIRSKSIFDCDIQHLPRSLKRVVMKQAIHLTDLCIPDLPPRLELLDIKHNTQISASCFPKLPYSLLYSQFDMSVVFASWSVLSGVLVMF